MSPTSIANESLEQAFLKFERAASKLQDRHRRLQDKVELLERQLIDANRRLEAVLDALGSGVAVVSRDGELVRTNQAFDRMELFAVETASHRAVSDLIAADPASGGSAQLRVETANGPREMVATLIPVGDADGTRVLCVQDVTEIRREEEEGGRRRRLEALGRMAAELAHEVRNPLGSIRLFACMLHEDLQSEDEKRTMTEQILSACSGLESTVANLLSFASQTKGEFKRVDLAALAREVCSLLAPASAVRGVRLEGPQPREECSIVADPEGMRQVLLNLVGNSLAATENDGTIGVHCAREQGRVTLAVTDNGKGIPAEDLPRVFDPFFTRREGGTGLGLSIVHGILERHGGRISLESRPGQGTHARVELPVDAGALRGEDGHHE